MAGHGMAWRRFNIIWKEGVFTVRRNYSENKLNELAEAIQKSNKPELVCDSLNYCPDWEKHIGFCSTKEKSELAQTWKYYPRCGKEIK